MPPAAASLSGARASERPFLGGAAAHRLLRAHLNGWFPMVGSWANRVLYLDVLAGRGSDAASPLVALDTLLDHARFPSFPTCDFSFAFLEREPAALAALEAGLRERELARGGWPRNVDVCRFPADLNALPDDLRSGLADQRRRLAPTFAVLRPLARGGVSLERICDLFGFERCELWLVVTSAELDRWSRTEGGPASTSPFAGEPLPELPSPYPARSARSLLDFYRRRLRAAGFRHVGCFDVADGRDRWTSSIVYATRGLRGMEAFKRAAWRVDPATGGRFSELDQASGQLTLFGHDRSGTIAAELRQGIRRRFAGRLVPAEEVNEFVVAETDFSPDHWKRVLGELEADGLLSVVSPRRKARTFPDGTLIRFR